MPTYDYICDGCKHEFEAFESITAPSQTDCPQCGAPSLRRKIGPGAAILFKGKGFYSTDYRSDNYKAGAKADKSGSETSSSTSTNPAPSTPAPAPAAGGGSSAPSTGGNSGS